MGKLGQLASPPVEHAEGYGDGNNHALPFFPISFPPCSFEDVRDWEEGNRFQFFLLCIHPLCWPSSISRAVRQIRWGQWNE